MTVLPPAAAACLLALLAGACRLAGPRGTDPLGARPADDRAASILEVRVTRVDADRMMPWRNGAPSTATGYGIAVASNLLLTTEELVRNHTLVELRRAGSGGRTPGRVVLADPRLNLALVTPADPAAVGRLRPLPPASGIRRSEKHVLVPWGANDRLQEAPATVVEISVERVSAAAPSLLTYDVSCNYAAAVGAPVLCDGHLAGIVLRSPGDNSYTVLAPEIVRAFLAAARRQPYPGVPSGGFEFAPLVDPVRRRYLGVPDDGRGVQVVSVFPGGTMDGCLRPEDVLISWDGLAVDDQGYYQDPSYGRLPLPHAVSGRHAAGETVPLTVWRDGRATNLTVCLKARADAAALIPENPTRSPPDYLVESGLVFREVTADYLHAAGSRWALRSSPRLVHDYLTRAQQPELPEQRLVVVSFVLPDPVNIGYQTLRDETVKAANGCAVTNLASLAAIVDRDSALADLELEGWSGAMLRLDPRQTAAANARVQRLYRLPALRRLSPPRPVP
jgi:hypothetical protein